uniref:Uncharacterized protein n=1 Tax=Manihot esculenta TaxID=3983 RepID=A0A2C9V6H9_MANES
MHKLHHFALSKEKQLPTSYLFFILLRLKVGSSAVLLNNSGA